jgi:hypothetical protein
MDHNSFRQARTRTLIQLGGLVEKTGLADHFDILLGADLQKDMEMKQPMAALVGALLELKRLLEEEQPSHSTLAEKGLRFLDQSRNRPQSKEEFYDDEAVT